jgi:hypothetical protein
MAAENVPQMRQDAVQKMQLFGQHPNIDPRRPLLKGAEMFGVKDPEAWLKQQDPPVPPAALEMRRVGVRAGVHHAGPGPVAGRRHAAGTVGVGAGTSADVGR